MPSRLIRCLRPSLSNDGAEKLWPKEVFFKIPFKVAGKFLQSFKNFHRFIFAMKFKSFQLNRSQSSWSNNQHLSNANIFVRSLWGSWMIRLEPNFSDLIRRKAQYGVQSGDLQSCIHFFGSFLSCNLLMSTPHWSFLAFASRSLRFKPYHQKLPF